MSAIMKELRSTVDEHVTVGVKIRDLEMAKRDLEVKIVEMVIDERMFEVLSINWSRLNRYIR